MSHQPGRPPFNATPKRPPRVINIQTVNTTTFAPDTPFMPTGKPAPTVMDIEEVAEFCRCSVRTIREAVGRGKLRPTPGARHDRFLLAEVIRYLKAATESGIA